MSKIVQQLRAEQAYRIASVAGALEVAQSKILLPKEEAAADALIAGVVNLLPGLERSGFKRHLLIQPTDPANKLGRVTLVLTYEAALPAQVTIEKISAGMQALATRGLAASFERIARAPEQLSLVPTGAEFEPARSIPTENVSDIPADQVRPNATSERPDEEAFDRACITTKDHFASKLGGQSLDARVRVESAHGNFVEIGGTVVRPKRSVEDPRQDTIVGVLNSISKTPPEIEIIGTVGGASKRKLTVTYEFEPELVGALAREFAKADAARILFTVQCNTESVIGRTSSTAYTLISYELGKPVVPPQAVLNLEFASEN